MYHTGPSIFDKNSKGWLQDITSVGLMHVGMNIPREFFKPFAVAAQETFEDQKKKKSKTVRGRDRCSLADLTAKPAERWCLKARSWACLSGEVHPCVLYLSGHNQT